MSTFNKSYILPEGMISYEISPVTIGMELLFLAKCKFKDGEYSFHLGLDDQLGELRVLPKQIVPYAVREMQDQLSEFIMRQYR